MRRYIFVGPTLTDIESLTAGFDVQTRPPVRAGDLLRAGLRRGDVAGIVDGYFHQVPAVRHKEILALLAEGVSILGAASMGALRAAELERYGMVGFGEIFADYRNGQLTADDEVALVHGSAADNYRAMSEPLVNIRATLARAVRESRCDEAVAAALVRHLAARPYRERGYFAFADIGRRIGLGKRVTAELVRFCKTHHVDRKRLDALELLAALRRWPGTAARPLRAVNRTIYLAGWQLSAAGLAPRRESTRTPTSTSFGDGSADGEALARTTEAVGDLAVLRACQVLADDFPAIYRELVFEWLSVRCVRRCGASALPPLPSTSQTWERAVAHGCHEGLYALPGADRGHRFLDAWVTPDERRGLHVKAQLAAYLVRSFRVGPGVPGDELMLGAVRDRPGFAIARRRAERSRTLAAFARGHRAGFDPSAIAGEAVAAALRARYGGTDRLDIAAFERGFGSVTSLLAAARSLYLLTLADGAEGAGFRLGPPAGLDRPTRPEPGDGRADAEGHTGTAPEDGDRVVAPRLGN